MSNQRECVIDDAPGHELDRRLAVSDTEGARRVGLGKTKFRELLNEGKIRSFYVGRRRLIPVAELERFIGAALVGGPK